jgi:HEPN domain-containing protein
MKAPDPAARWIAVERWLAVADRDRRTVLACMAADPPLRDSAAFHCQQAIEKLFKGFLTLAGKRSRKTHSLSQLGVMAQESFPELVEFVASVDNWSKWVAEFRYPGGTEPEPDETELRRALHVIDRLAASLRAKRP